MEAAPEYGLAQHKGARYICTACGLNLTERKRKNRITIVIYSVADVQYRQHIVYYDRRDYNVVLEPERSI